jgi:hypothetical protein
LSAFFDILISSLDLEHPFWYPFQGSSPPKGYPMTPEEHKKRGREQLQTKAKRLINGNPILAEFHQSLSKKDQEELQLLITSARYHLAPHTSALDPIILSALLAQQKQFTGLRNEINTLRLNQTVGAQHAAPSSRNVGARHASPGSIFINYTTP